MIIVISVIREKFNEKCWIDIKKILLWKWRRNIISVKIRIEKKPQIYSKFKEILREKYNFFQIIWIRVH